MADRTRIGWTDATWNPVVGCSVVSPGCTNCYAMKMAARLQKMNLTGGSGTAYVNHYDGTTAETKGGPVWTGKVAVARDELFLKPLGWKRPRRIFVNSMGDLFHESVPNAWIDRVFAVMALAPQHTFQVLTKRSKRMREYLTERNGMGDAALCRAINEIPFGLGNRHGALEIPLPNVWLGVSAEDQRRADERIPDLLATPAAARFVSAEPLLGPIDFAPPADATYQRLSEWYGPNGFDETGSQPRATRMAGWFPRLDWIIVGGESGPSARPMHPDWARAIRDQCAAAGVPFFFKQWGEWKPLDQITEKTIEGAGAHGVIARDGHFVKDTDLADPPDKMFTFRVGKRRAGRLLDGIEHNAFPEARQ